MKWRHRDNAKRVFHNGKTDRPWRVLKSGTDSRLRIVAGDEGPCVVADLDAAMEEEAHRICVPVNHALGMTPVDVLGMRADGDETLREWRDRTERAAFTLASIDPSAPPGEPTAIPNSASLAPHMPGAWLAHEDGDDGSIVVWVETESGCWGHGVQTRWDEPAWYVIQAAVEMGAEHVAEQIAHDATVLGGCGGPQSAVPRYRMPLGEF